jgi:hypothetical protein
MNKYRGRIKWVLILVCCAVAGMSPSDSSAALTPIDPFQAEALPDPNPPVFTFQSSIAYYNNSIIYAGSDGKIYAYDVASKSSVPVSDTSSLGSSFAAVTAFMVSSDDYLYFTDNGVTSNIYRLKLTDPWPVSAEQTQTLDTGITSSIFAFAENPWTNTVWLCSGDFFVNTDNFYLYEVDTAFTKVTERSSFEKPNAKPDGSGNGPIIFSGPDTVLYGEATFSGPGYFHLVNSSTGDVQANYLTFDGGLGDATYGYNKRIYATSGGGKTVFELRGSADPLLVGATDNEARGITFGEGNFYLSEMIPFSGGADAGKSSLNKGWDPNAINEINPVDPFRARALPDPNPPVFTFQSSIAYYNNSIIYAGSDGKIYAYDVASKSSVPVSDTSSLGSSFAAVTAFMVSSDDYLYFTDNGVTSNIYRLKLTDPWPVSAEQTQTLDTGITSSIFAFAENPWTNTVWLCSGDFFVNTDNFYLYEVDTAFTKVTERSSFEKPNAKPDGSGNGPIIFSGPDTVLYGEATFSGPGYFHLVNSSTGDVQANYLTFDGGLGDATYGYNNRIYVTTGGGKSIFELDGTQQKLLAKTYDEARGITFDGNSLFISAMVPFSGSADDGESSLLELWQTRLVRVPADQQVDDSVDLNSDSIPDNQQPDVILSANTAGGSGSKQIGVSPVGTTVVVEALESVAASTIDETANRPTDLPFDLVNYRLKVTSADGIARVVVYLSEPAPADAKWYKYDSIEGWIDYSDHATLSADLRSVTLELKDGDYGDLDRIVNGEIVDPGGLGVTTSTLPPPTSSGGGGGGGCFIDSAGSAVLYQSHPLIYLFIASVLCFGIVTLSRRWNKQ